jgi:hypothetical protein
MSWLCGAVADADKKGGLEGRPPNLEDFNENTLHVLGGDKRAITL